MLGGDAHASSHDDDLLVKAAGAEPIGTDEARALLGPAIERGHAVIAVSGGPDSIALMRLCAAIASEGSAARLSVATVHHGLRAASEEEAARVGLWARQCGFDHAILVWDGEKPSTGLQEKARTARYRLLAAHARTIGASSLITAHTQDDQSETVLMRLAHGSGLAGLAAMRPVSIRDGLTHLRPLLGIAKARLLATCAANDWAYVDDPSNADPRFERARWRAAMPALMQLGLTPPRLARLADRLALAEDALDDKAKQAFSAALVERQSPLVIDFAALRSREPREIVLRVLFHALVRIERRDDPTTIRLERAEAALEAIDAACAKGRMIKRTLAGTVFALDSKGHVSLRREGPRKRGRGDRAMSGRPARTERGNSNALLPLV